MASAICSRFLALTVGRRASLRASLSSLAALSGSMTGFASSVSGRLLVFSFPLGRGGAKLVDAAARAAAMARGSHRRFRHDVAIIGASHSGENHAQFYQSGPSTSPPEVVMAAFSV